MTAGQRLAAWRLALAVTLSLAVVVALLPQPPALPIGGIGDKWAHALTFATLALLASLAYPDMPIARIGERLSFLGALIEMFQSIPALRRDCDVLDWLADTAAIVVVLALVAFTRRHAAAAPETNGSI